jgi:predicted phosphodiesterase
VMGNADDWLLTGRETGTEEQIAVREWTLSRLSDDDRAFIAQFSPTVTVELPGGRQLLAFHGSPASYDDDIWPGTPDEVFAAYLGPYAGLILCGGHTHRQQLRPVGPYFFFNPGSVGRAQPSEPGATRVNPWAEYAVLTAEGGTLSLEFRRIPLDVERLVAIIRASRRPYAEEMAVDYTPTGP